VEFRSTAETPVLGHPTERFHARRDDGVGEGPGEPPSRRAHRGHVGDGRQQGKGFLGQPPREGVTPRRPEQGPAEPLQRPSDLRPQPGVLAEVGIAAGEAVPRPRRQGPQCVPGPVHPPAHARERCGGHAVSAPQVPKEFPQAANHRPGDDPWWHFASTARHQREGQHLRHRLPPGLLQNAAHTGPPEPRADDKARLHVAGLRRAQGNRAHPAARVEQESCPPPAGLDTHPQVQAREGVTVLAQETLGHLSPIAACRGMERNGGAAVGSDVETRGRGGREDWPR